MKFTQISTLALAAMMAFSSCSKEEVMNPGEADLLPGEAQIVFDLGRKGATTYATIATETKIWNAQAKLFTSTGDSIPAKFIFDEATKKLSATIAAKDANAKGVTFFAYVNYKDVATGVDKVVEGASGTAMEKHAAAKVTTEVDRSLKNGAPAGIRVDGINLTPGLTTTIEAKPAKRAIARISAKSGNGVTIEGYHLKFDKVQVSEGLVYAGMGNQGSTAEGPKTDFEYKMQFDGNIGGEGVFADRYETVGYLYPSSEVTILVKPTKETPDADGKTVKFTPRANMNYCINISPKTAGPGEVDFTVSIESKWDENKEDMDADFNINVDPLDLAFMTLPAKATFEKALIKLHALTAASEQSIELLNGIATTKGNVFDEITNIKIDSSAYTAGKPVYARVKIDGTAIKVSQAVNLSGVKSPDIKVIVTGKSGGEAVSGYFKICVDAVSKDYADAMNEATVEMDGKKWLMFDQKSEIGWCYDQALAIKAAGGFTEETIRNNHNLFMLGSDYEVSAATKCPLGYKRPTLADYISLMDTHKVGANLEPKWVPAVGNEKVFANTRVLKNVWNDGIENGRGYYTLTEGAKVMHIIASKGYQTSTPTDGSLGDTPVVAGNYYAFAPWSNGITYSQMDGNTPNGLASLRCIVDPTYVDAGL